MLGCWHHVFPRRQTPSFPPQILVKGTEDMRSTFKSRVLLGLTGLLTVGSLIATPGVASAAPCPAGGPAQYVDARATEGQEIAGSPKKYEFGDSPYIGARYDKCARLLKIYFGGYNGITHYNIRYDSGNQYELAPHERGVWSPKHGDSLYEIGRKFSVQACKRGSGLSSSSCTRWSPVISFNA
jgi:hypothetical protein